MKFRMIHENLNVADLERSIRFYNEALDLHEVRRKTTDDFIIVYLKSEVGEFELELTWLKDHPQPYDLGGCEFHLAFRRTILTQRTKSTRRWAASASKTKRWESTSSKIRTATGLRFCRNGSLL